jgi:hypothetical protein
MFCWWLIFPMVADAAVFMVFLMMFQAWLMIWLALRSLMGWMWDLKILRRDVSNADFVVFVFASIAAS